MPGKKGQIIETLRNFLIPLTMSVNGKLMEKWELEYKIKTLCQNKCYIIKPFLECIRFLAIKIQSSDTIKTPTISNPK